MQKRILALALVVLLISASFAGCGKKKNTIVAKNKREYEAVTDDKGNLQYDAQGDVIVYQKDENGKYIKDEKGNKKTFSVETKDTIVDDLKVENPYFRFNLKARGWDVNDRGTFYKKGTDDKVVLFVNPLRELRDGETFDSMAPHLPTDPEQLAFLKEYDDSLEDKTERKPIDVEITEQKIKLKGLETTYRSRETDEVVGYEYAAMFMAGDMVCEVHLYVNDGKYYSEKFDLTKLLDEGLVIK